ncbi:phthiocerol/phthiodiolone dimycocerosyl transferase family protein [Nocardia pseudobrasiliensis]|uniref:Phthiocerol/phthiodiolone dimycocerosyl transferase n=1 Tax=Nocardia pseudobrasiliensis TaxID=45979 RepID=A0A370HKH7_9NOCA|nr:hypothetical protein [Nocardia pseudobrasiliensis]RDI58947.1 phthiocerol/phthiodiolone dimycocerosyl transferase-like enzyme [Nocardia pseudobrasiliensis]
MTIAAMTKQQLIRPLERTEKIYAAEGLCIGYSVHVHGDLHIDTLTEAFDTLRRDYPSLGCRIIGRADGGADLVATAEPPLVVVDYDPLAEQPILDLDNRTAAVHVQFHETDRAWVTLFVHHAIADGRYGLHLLTDLWAYFTALSIGCGLLPRPHGYPISPEHLLAQRNIAAIDRELPLPAPTRATALNPHPARKAFPRVQLSPHHTHALVRLAHRTATSVHSLASAVLLQAAADIDAATVADLRYAYPVDLRPRLNPPVSATAATNALGTAFFTADPRTPTDAPTIAGAITNALIRDLTTGRVQSHYLNTVDYLNAIDAAFSYHPGSVLTANWGVVPELQSPKGITIDDLRPVWHATASAGTSSIRTLLPDHLGIITTYQGRLSYEIATSDPDPDTLAIRLHARFDTLLESL